VPTTALLIALDWCSEAPYFNTSPSLRVCSYNHHTIYCDIGTKQACGFKDNYAAITKAGYDVYGMSFDKPKSQVRVILVVVVRGGVYCIHDINCG